MMIFTESLVFAVHTEKNVVYFVITESYTCSISLLHLKLQKLCFIINAL